MTTRRLTPVVLGALLLFAGTAAEAETIDATVPFAFTVQHHLLPAGKYSIERDADHPTTLVIREIAGAHATVVVSTMTASGHNPIGQQQSMVFTHRDNAYQLKDVWQSRNDGEAIVPAR